MHHVYLTGEGRASRSDTPREYTVHWTESLVASSALGLQLAAIFHYHLDARGAMASESNEKHTHTPPLKYLAQGVGVYQ